MDFLFASNVFEHVPKPELTEILAHLKKKLSPRGNLCLVQPNYRYCYKEYFDDYTHVSIFSHVSYETS